MKYLVTLFGFSLLVVNLSGCGGGGEAEMIADPSAVEQYNAPEDYVDPGADESEVE